MTPTSADTNEENRFWKELDAQFRGPLFAYFLRRVQNRSEAEDLTQEAFVRLTRHPDKSQGHGGQAYIFTIAANLLTDRARSRHTRKFNEHSSLGDILDGANYVPQLSENRDPERVLIARESLRNVMAALNALSERTRDIFILSHLENMPYRDIAGLYGISVSAVEKHIMKALAHLGAMVLRS